MPNPQNKNSEESQLQVQIYSAEKSGLGLISTFKKIIKEFPAAHSLGLKLAERSIRTRYRQSVFGFLWAFLPPLATAALWIILNKSKVISFGDVGASYPIFVITGTMLWAVFANSILMPMNVMQANRSILVKINFPRESLIINAFYEVLFNTLISFIIILLCFVFFKIDFSFRAFLFFPDLLILMLLGMSIGLLLLPFSLLFRDIQFVLPTVLQFAMYLTPVVYAKQPFAGVTSILKFNPVSPVLTHARSSLLHMDAYVPLWQIGSVAAIAILLIVIGIFFQRKAMQIIIERMGT